MKCFAVVIPLFFVVASFSQNDYIKAIESARVSAQKEMLEEVLDSVERKSFEGICYFPIDSNYRVEATFHKSKGKVFYMPMTKARKVRYQAVGYLEFKIHDSLCKLTLYRNLDLTDPAYKSYYFLPFKDGTTALSTYGAGRYLDVYRRKKQKRVILDFNKAYHPYCAYSDRYSCPIVPKENTIVPYVTAGECYHNSH
jgi:uncharacterized protein (DUF1684 family)